MDDLKPYEVENNSGTVYVLEASPSKAKSAVFKYGWWGNRQDGGDYKDYRARIFNGESGDMEQGQVYLQLCETCGRPCNEQNDLDHRDLGDPDRCKKAVCEFCDPGRR